MRKSGVSKMDKDVGKKTEEWRTSATHFLGKVRLPLPEMISFLVNKVPWRLHSVLVIGDQACTETVKELEDRVAFVSKISPRNAEGVQVSMSTLIVERKKSSGDNVPVVRADCVCFVL